MKKIFLFAVIALALTSCDNNDENQVTPQVAATITATIGESIPSRAVDASWKPYDRIGISSTIGDTPGPYINVEYITEKADGKFTGKDLFFYKPMTLTAYYPYTGSDRTPPGNNGVISANTREENQTEENQPTIDFLWDSKTGVDKKDFSASNPNVNFNFTHRMSKLTFIFQSSDPVYDPKNPDKKISDGVDVATMISYKIDGLGVEGEFNTATGVCAIDESKGREGIEITFDKVSAVENKERAFPSLIVFPQTKPDDGYMLHITTDELNKEGDTQKYAKQNYKCALRFTDGEIKPGHHYKFTIKVTKLGLIVGDLTIEPWSEEEKFVIATIDGDEVFKDQSTDNPIEED